MSAGGVAALAAGCGGRKPNTIRLPKPPRLVRREDVETLNHLLDLENRVVAAYTAGIPLLNGAAAKAAQHFLDQDLTHAGELSGLIRRAHGKANKPRPAYDLGRPRNSREVLGLLHTTETAVIAAYFDAISRLTPGEVRAAVASLLANDAQHVSVLRALLGQPPLPSAFVSAGQ